MAGHQIFLAAVTVSELRYGALVADWGEARRRRLEEVIGRTTVVPVTDALLTVIAELRHACRNSGHPFMIGLTPTISGSPGPRFTSELGLSRPIRSSTTPQDSISTDRSFGSTADSHMGGRVSAPSK